MMFLEVRSNELNCHLNRCNNSILDANLGAMMLVLLLLHLMQYAMRDPCSC